MFAERDPADLPWGDVGADVVIESTGFFTKRDDAAKHLEAGAKKVIISAPATEPDVTLVLGVNDDAYDPRAAPRHLERVVHDQLPGAGGEGAPRAIGIERGMMTTIHAYTADQRLQDARTRTCAGRAPPRSTWSRPRPAPRRRSAW